MVRSGSVALRLSAFVVGLLAVMTFERRAGADEPAAVSLGEAGAACRWAGDCAAGVCENQRCAGPSCADGVQNGDEAAVDCGGGCGRCPDRSACRQDGDCQSGICTDLVEPARPGVAARSDRRCSPVGSCTDRLRDGRETGIDCGGGACRACEDDQGCQQGSDCTSGLCINNLCRAGGSCHDGQQGQQETDVDCGGLLCSRCGEGKACRQNEDCASLLCDDGRCRPAPPRASDFLDTRINFTLTDENVLVGPGQTNPNVPGVRIDRPNQFGVLFFDNYDTRYTGYENLTHLVLYKKYESDKLRLGRFSAEGALAVRLLEFSDINISLLDDSSYIRLALSFDAERTPSSLALTVFPLSADRMRLGYSYRLSWGGSPIFYKFNPDLSQGAGVPAVNQSAAPGARLQYTREHFSLWAGFKTSVLLNRNPSVLDQQAIHGFLGGFSVEGAVAARDSARPLFLRFDANGGYFDRGNNPLFYPTDTAVGGRYPDFPVWTAGGSLQLSLWRGLPPSLSEDYRLFRNDPISATRYYARPVYRPGFNWLLQSEVTYLATTLQDVDAPSSTTLQYAYAGDVNLRIQVGYSRIKLDASVRSLEFLLVNQPSFSPYSSLPRGSTLTADQFVSLGYDYHIPRAGLTIGPTVGVDLPASVHPPRADPRLCGNIAGAPTCTSALVVVRGEGDYSVQAQSRSQPAPILAGKLVVRADFLTHFAAILDIYATHDPNLTRLTVGGDGTRNFSTDHPDSLGFNLTLQARF